MTTIVLEVKDEYMIVEHGHHNTIATEPETKNVIKITQQEYIPYENEEIISLDKLIYFNLLKSQS